MAKNWLKRVSLLLAAALLLAACGTSASTSGQASGGGGGTAAGGGKMTDVGTPRSETLIVDILNGQAADPMLMNPYLPGAVPMDAGLHQLLFSHLWEINTQTGEQFPELAGEMPQALDETYTKFRFTVREGLTWSDGEPFTAADIEYTANMLLQTPTIPYSGYFATLVKSMKAVDEKTIEMETVQPEAKIAQKLGVEVWGVAFRIMPKHVWEKEDPATFKNSDPVTVGAYTLKDRDTQSGNWFLYEKRADWENTVVGQIAGEPKPQYVLFKYFGPEEKRIMAAINNELDILQDITPESMEILLNKSDTISAWYNQFPYATMDDPCERGMAFNVAKAPFDNVDVRWALALATDIQSVSMGTFGGMLRVSPLQVPPIAVLQETYHIPMTPWLKDFALADGYKPFDDSYASSMVKTLSDQGVEGLPTDPEEITNVFGVGWFKYDTEKAYQLLEKNGFTKSGDKWMLPDGTPWKIVINAPANFEIQSMRLAFAVADAWRKFGIDTEVKQMDAATFWNAEATGDFEVGSYWPACGLLPDTSVRMNQWHKKFIAPVGEIASANYSRWSNDRVSELLDELAALPSDDPQVIEKITEINQIFVAEIPFLPMFGTSKFVPVNSYYWEGFQNSENPYEGPWWWWSQFKYYLPHISPSGK